MHNRMEISSSYPTSTAWRTRIEPA
jgi:hypothetical protein